MKRFIICFLLVIGMAGCASWVKEAAYERPAADAVQADGPSETAENGQDGNKELEVSQDSFTELDYDKARQKIGLNGSYIEEELKRQEDNYCLEYLDKHQKQLYIEIYSILVHQAKDIQVSSVDVNELETAFQCVLNDHPEIFYVSGYTYTKYTYGEEVKRITFTGTYTMKPEIVEKRQAQMEEYITECLSGISPDAEDYEKVKYVYEYLIYHTDYNLDSEENQNICSVFLNKESVCQGYAKATQLLLNRLGVMATMVIGTVESGEGHAWNLVKVNGAYYYVDTTWGDAFYVLGESEYDYPEEKMPNINYDYLLVTTQQLCETHSIDNVVPMPRCVATEANYYVREGAYFTALDRDGIGALFEKAYAQGEELVTMKFSSLEVYREVERALLDEQEVFEYLKSGDGMVAYTNSEKQLSISFWI